MNYQEDARRARRERQFGSDATCRLCGESDPVVLVAADLCYRCRLNQSGKTGVEEHHPAGRANSPVTVPVPANDHRVLNELQQAWPRDTLRNPDGSPLLLAAASIRGWLDVLRLLIERTLGWVPRFLEDLDAWLRQRLSARWWEDFQWEG